MGKNGSQSSSSKMNLLKTPSYVATGSIRYSASAYISAFLLKEKGSEKNTPARSLAETMDEGL